MRARTMLVAGVLVTTAVPASAATVSLSLDQARSSIPQGSAFTLKSGALAYQAPFTGFSFIATATNDGGGPVLPPPATPGGQATIDLIGRTADGVETVLSTQTIFDANPITFPIQFVQQSTTYLARLNASATAGVAAATLSNEFQAATYLRNYPNAFHSNLTRRVTFSGFVSRVDSVPAASAVRVLIQRRSGTAWKTLKILTPNAKREYRAVVPTGKIPAIFRVRVIPVGAVKRYVAFTDASYCVARTSAAANKACRSVRLGP